MKSLHNCYVILIEDVFDDEGNVLASEGDRFLWDDDSESQNVNGRLIYVDPEEVEITYDFEEHDR